MQDGRVTAPGKAVIVGEYAVLRGATAVVMAIDRRASVRVRPPRSARSSVVTPGHAEGKWAFDVTGARVEWTDATGPSIIEAVVSVLPDPHDLPLDISIDTAAFVDTTSGSKLGLGSSAAAVTALVAALAPAATGDSDLHQLASTAHRAFQGGLGSGIDVAASCAGGTVTFTRDAGITSRIDWPTGLHYRFFFSGHAASTRDAISRTAGIADSDGAWQELVASADSAALGVASGDAVQARSSIKAYGDALQVFDEAHGAGIFSAGHGELHRRAIRAGLVYKPCGAGGGDIGVALDTDADRLDAFSAIADELGFVPLDLQMDNSGVARQTMAQQ
jgi:phosphomevalonate kinase